MEFYEDFSKDQVASLRSGHRFEIPAFPDTTGSSEEIQAMAGVVWKNVDDYLSKVLSVRSDQRYSDFGRAEQIEPISDTAHLRLLGAWHLVTEHEAKLNVREQQLIGVPKIDLGNSLAHLEDKEIRDWWGRQNANTRSKYMERAKNGDPDATRMSLAIMRSPVPQIDIEKSFFRTVWEDSRRAQNPVEAEAISLGRRSISWIEKNLGYATVVAEQTFKQVPRDRTLRFALTATDGAFVSHVGRLGFSREEVSQMQLRMKHGR